MAVIVWWLSCAWLENWLLPAKWEGYGAYFFDGSHSAHISILYFVLAFRNLRTTFPRCICQATSLLALPTGVIRRKQSVQTSALEPKAVAVASNAFSTKVAGQCERRARKCITTIESLFLWPLFDTNLQKECFLSISFAGFCCSFQRTPGSASRCSSQGEKENCP